MNRSTMLTVVAALAIAAFAAPSRAALLLSDSFETPVSDTSAPYPAPTGWTYVDILTAGDHSALGVAASGATSGGGAAVPSEDGSQFLYGGRSTDWAIQVAGSMLAGHEYIFSVYSHAAGSSYNIARIYMTDALQDSARSITPLTGTAVSASGGASWVQYTSTYTATASDAGNPLYINLESYRDVSTAIVAWDNVHVAAVPTPAALPAGLILITGMTIRRRRA